MLIQDGLCCFVLKLNKKNKFIQTERPEKDSKSLRKFLTLFTTIISPREHPLRLYRILDTKKESSFWDVDRNYTEYYIIQGYENTNFRVCKNVATFLYILTFCADEYEITYSARTEVIYITRTIRFTRLQLLAR